MAAKPKPTLADYVTIALSPALIMALIVSVAFFLVAICYRGDYAGRLHAILFFFTFGIVLVARIAMETGLAERAPLYGLVLAVLVWLGMGIFVDYPRDMAALSWLINAGLVALVWWLAYQITYSCTYIDEKAESTGTGVLQAAGLENGAEAAAPTPSSPQEETRPAPKRRPPWWVRYQRYRDQRRQTQPPGVWVVYFALAALPIFGLGQSLIDVDDVARRNHTFWLMVMYLASSLGLLVTTAFLGLRRYLRQRHLEMPKLVTTAWLGLGGILLVALVFLGAVLPRPQSEFSVLEFAGLRSHKLSASKFAVTSGDPGQGPGRPGAQKHDPEGKPVNSGKQDAGKGGQGQAKGAGRQKDQKGSDSQPAKKSDDSANKKDHAEADRSTDQEATTSPDLGRSSWLMDTLTMASKLLKWIIFAVVVVVTLFFILTGGLRYLANFCDWAARLLAALRRFWESLFANAPRENTRVADGGERTEVTHVPFQAFSNPFTDGQAQRMSPADVVRYSFRALEAWANDNDCSRDTQETPIEFTNRLATEIGALERETKNLGYLYARVLYARGDLPPEWRNILIDFWKRLDSLPARTLVAPAR